MKLFHVDPALIVKHLSASLTAGFLIGGILGSVEYLISLFDAGFQRAEKADLNLIFLSYSVHWGLIIAVGGLLLASRGRKRDQPWSCLFASYATLSLIGGIAVYLTFSLRPLLIARTFSIIAYLYYLAVLVAIVVSTRRGWAWATKLNPAVRWCVVLFATLLWCSVLLSAPFVGDSTSALWSAVGGSQDNESGHSRPNVLFITVDTLRADHLGCYGYPRSTSPVIDQLASQGIQFSRCIAASSWTRPSTASILTGLFPAYHNQNRILSVLPPETTLFPDVAGTAGYRTAFISTNPMVGRSSGYGRNVDFYRGVDASLSTSLSRLLVASNSVTNRLLKTTCRDYTNVLWKQLRKICNDHLITSDAQSVADTFLAFLNQDLETPFFAYLHFMDPHIPYQPEPHQLARFGDPEYGGPDPTSPPWAAPESGIPPFASQIELPEDQKRRLIDRYDGEIADFDAALGKTIQTLKETGLYDRTLIVLTSDHGEAFFEHGAWQHRNTLFRETIHVPLIFKLPRSINAGTTLEGLCRHVDIVPTLLDLLDMPPWPDLQGISLAGAIAAADEDWGGESWAISDSYVQDYYLVTYIEGNKKIVHITGPEEHWILFDLTENPGEYRTQGTGDPEEMESFKKKMMRRLEDLQDGQLESHQREGLTEDMQKIRSIGY